jgi:hypothetical protein
VTSPYDAHVGAVEALKNELDRLAEQIHACKERAENDVLAMAGQACGQDSGPAAEVFGQITQISERMDEALGHVNGAKEAADAYRATWGPHA